jgi:hypothetical protein
MNGILLLFALLFMSASISGQKKHKYENNTLVDFSMADGSTVRGYYLGEETRRSSLIPIDLRSSFVSFLYADLESDKNRTLSASEVQKITFYDGEDVSKIQEKIKVKGIDNGANSSTATSEVFEYLLYDGKIKLYGSNVFLCQNGGCTYSHANLYLKHHADPYAVLAVKAKKKLSFKLGSSIENITDAFRSVGGKCSSFNDYIDFFDKTMMKEQQLDKKMQADYHEIYKQTIKDLGKGKNLLRLYDVVAERVLAHQMKVYVGVIHEYEKNCP